MQTKPVDVARPAELDNDLSLLAGQWDGAVDFWSLVCLADVVPDPHAWIQAQLKKMRGHSASVPTSPHTTRVLDRTQQDQLDLLSTACDNLEVVFAIFVNFRAVAPDEVRAAARAFARNHELALRTIRSLGNSLGVPVSYLQTRKDDHAAYIRGILEHLPGQFEEFRNRQPSELGAPG